MNKQPLISIICAISENRAIGKNNQLLWDIPEDMRFFRNKTKNHTVIMGRKTYESIGRPLPQRHNIVITRNTNFQSKEIKIVNSLLEALKQAKKIEKEEIFIIGGGEIYEQSMSYADKLYLTVVKKIFVADTFFPDYFNWQVIQKKDCKNNEYEFSFLELIKKNIN